ncbi:MAG: hypothetical protein AAFW83_10300 [Pseudomonadota bacterium]
MKLLFVHGINQDKKSSAQVEEEWVKAILETSIGDKIIENFQRQVPFYGDLLVEKKARKKGHPDYTQEELEFKNSIANEMADYLLTQGDHKIKSSLESEYFENGEERAKGFPHNPLFIKFAQAVEKVSPFRGEIAMRFLEQAYLYYSDQNLRRNIDTLVASAIEDAGECALVSHSLGTVVSYRAAHHLGNKAKIKKFITLGSPLGLNSFRTQLGEDLYRPPGVSNWLNAHDPRDFVSMGISLQKHYEHVDLEHLDVRNTDKDPHAISEDKGYLHDECILNWLLN